MDKKTRHERAVAREASIREQRYRTSVEIITRRLKAKLDRAALAKKAGSTEAHIKALEVGQKEPTVSELERIADALRCTVADLLPPLTPGFCSSPRLSTPQRSRSVERCPTFCGSL